MKELKPNLDYYQVVVDTQNDAEILKCELQDLINETENFLSKILPFLNRLVEPRHDKCETNEYVCNSSDCKIALNAVMKYNKGLNN